MFKKIQKARLFKLIGMICLSIFLIYFVFNMTTMIGKGTDTFMVEEGVLSYEEPAQGYIIRDETVLKGNNYSNGISQIVPDGKRVSIGENVFRYYSNNEAEINSKIKELDKQIDEALQNGQNQITSIDIINLESEIKNVLGDLYETNSIQEIQDYQKRLSSYALKKAEIAGDSSPAGSYIKDLIEQRAQLSNQLTSDSEIIATNISGVVSYRVDGLEEILKINNKDFSYLNKDLLEGFNLNVGSTVPESTEAGKVVNNYYCYIACVINSENSEVAKLGNTVSVRFSDGTEVNATIEYIKDEEKDRILVFKIEENVEKLLEYRKISFDIIWWKYTGLKVSNSALIEEDDLTYVKRTKAGIEEKILVQVLRQNSTYSIVNNYTEEKLKEMGFSLEEIENMPKIKVYDQIMVNTK